jgi:putative FmdB family regulatory protein
MPTYEYKCTKCAHTFEIFQSMTDAPRKRCPKCSGKVERLISGGAGLLFKGSGFYITDYRSDSYKSAAKADKPSSSKESSSGKGKEKKKAKA